MSGTTAQEARRKQRVTEWLLALLRYAITLEDVDKSSVLVLAEKIDGLHSEQQRLAFEFFRRTTIQLCKAMADKEDPNRIAVLRLHLKRIDDHCLRRAFQAVIQIGDGERIVETTAKVRRRGRENLWKGLRR